MSQIADNLGDVRARIASGCQRAGLSADEVGLIAVSKTQPAAAVAEARAAGQLDFGENYLQEALAKIRALPDMELRWHFIGPIQSNKTGDIAAHFDWVHTVDRIRIAERLSAQRPAGLPQLKVCVQVNISAEPSKSGCTPAEAPMLCSAIARLPGLHLRGLMAIPRPAAADGDPQAAFRLLRQLHAQIRATLPPAAQFDTLSAGMSDDLEAAILQGSTLVRIGTAIFGSRQQTP